MPLAVFEIVWQVVSDAVLIAQLRGDFIKHALDLAAAILGPTA